MIRIAICDDDEQAVPQHETIARQCLSAHGIGFEIATYTRSDNLLCDIVDDHFFFDLILLDIEMPDVSGMEIAERIKPILPNVKIIFITSHLEYAVDAYEFSIFRYVPKMDLEKRLWTAIADAAKLIELEAGRVYTIQSKSRLEKIPYKGILYIQRSGKNADIVSESGISKVRKSLQQVYDELCAEEFIFIDRGCIVNMVQIMKISGGMAILRNGKQLPISRSHLREAKQQLNAYWGAHI